MDDKLSININIANRNYPMKIDRGEEEMIRKAAKIINEKILKYRQRYSSTDYQDVMAMTALQFVVQNLNLEKEKDVSPVVEKLEIFNDLITQYLDGA